MATTKTKPATKPANRPAPQQQRAVATTTRPAQESQQSSRAVASTEKANVPSYLQERAQADAGKGVSTSADDNLVPLIYVLQSNSPQCQRGNPKQIQGAEQGFLWLRNAPEELQLVHPDEGALFQSCHFSKDWVEWLPNRGGFVGRHPERPEAAELVEEESDDGKMRKVWRMPSGNAVVETRYHEGYIYFDGVRQMPYVIPLSSTGHSVSKAWMFAMNGEQVDGFTLPSFAVIYRLSTELRQKDNNSWYVLKVTKERYATEEEYEIGLALHNAFSSGEKRADIDDDGLGEEGTSEEVANHDGKI